MGISIHQRNIVAWDKKDHGIVCALLPSLLHYGFRIIS